MNLDKNCDSCWITKINIVMHESFGDPDSKEANLTFSPLLPPAR